jgi:hypothetical protein
MLSNKDGWAVGANGVFLRYKVRVVPTLPAPTTAPTPSTLPRPTEDSSEERKGPCGAAALALLPVVLTAWIGARKRKR